MTTSNYVSQLLGSNFNHHYTSGLNRRNYDVTNRLNYAATNQHGNNTLKYINDPINFSGSNQDFNNNQVWICIN